MAKSPVARLPASEGILCRELQERDDICNIQVITKDNLFFVPGGAIPVIFCIASDCGIA
jgi:hypothetical protein